MTHPEADLADLADLAALADLAEQTQSVQKQRRVGGSCVCSRKWRGRR